MTFIQEFFRIYDRAISGGICSFTQTGITKDDFTRLCTDSEFALSEEAVRRACLAMEANGDETELLVRLARGESR